MNQDLVDEINDLIVLLTKSGFFSTEEILEILEDQFIEDDVDFSNFKISQNNFSNNNFSILDKTFKKLANNSIVAVHNCGYDFREGVEDIYELYLHLVNNKYEVQGFCFYSFEDVEQAIEENILKLTFGDFEKNENKALEIGKIIYNTLSDANFDLNWDYSVNMPIEIINFNWDKKFNNNCEYEIEGAYMIYTGVLDEK